MDHLEPLTEELVYKKSNMFATAKFKASTTEQKIMALALSRIEINAKDKEAPLEARLYPGELKQLVSDPAHIYRDLAKTAITLTGHVIFLEDGMGNFQVFSIVPNCTYKDGVLIVKFNNALRDHILGLEKNYTSLHLGIIMSLKKTSSLRIYEVLKKDAYKIAEKKNGEPFVQVEYNLSEFRFIIGLANSDDPNVKRATSNNKKIIDWDALYEKLDKSSKKCEEWGDFQRRILRPAQEELEEKSDIRFTYEGIKIGRKIKKIRFTIYWNQPRNTKEIDERRAFIEASKAEYRQTEFPMDEHLKLYEDLVGHNHLAKEDVDLLLLKADWNDNLVRKCVELADRQKSIRNYMGWIISAIENGYEEVATMDGDAEKAKDFARRLEEYKNPSPEQCENLWNIAKSMSNYPEFLNAIINSGLSKETFETIFPPLARAHIYFYWRLHKEINLNAAVYK